MRNRKIQAWLCVIVMCAGLCSTPWSFTCIIWRRRAIDDAGGWHADTLTEGLEVCSS